MNQSIPSTGRLKSAWRDRGVACYPGVRRRSVWEQTEPVWTLGRRRGMLAAEAPGGECFGLGLRSV